MTIVSRFFECLELSGIKPYDIEVKFGVKSAQSKISQLKGQKTKGGKDKTLPVETFRQRIVKNNKPSE